MTAVLRAQGLGKRYRQRWALAGCDLDIPAGRVTGLVGPNGAGKSTLLGLAAGLLAPTAGTIEVCGGRPGSSQAQLDRVGFVAQDAPVYASLTVADHLRLGARLSPGWDQQLAEDRIRRLGLAWTRRAGHLSGGQRAQLALTLAVAKRPQLLILDEPVASLDPLARDGFLRDLRDVATGAGVSVLLSSHLVADLERTCDYLIALVASRVRVAGPVDDLLASHRVITGPAGPLPVAGPAVIAARTAGGQTTALIRTGPGEPDLAWRASLPGLEDLVLAYLGGQDTPGQHDGSAGTSAGHAGCGHAKEARR
jgi:ABC-2 type transport system ATP-binding protein